MKRTTRSRTRTTTPTVAIRRSPVRASAAPVHDTLALPASREWSVLSRFTAVTLILFFILVPVSDAFADTSEVPPSAPIDAAPAPEAAPVEPAPVVESTPAEVQPDVPAPEPSIAEAPAPVVESAPEETVLVPEPSPADIAPVPPVDVPPSDAATSSTSGSSTEQPVDMATTTDTLLPPVEDATTTEPVVEPVVPPVDVPVVPATTTPEVVAPVPVVPVATTTEVAPAVVPETSTHSTDADRFTFGVSECVPVGNGAFHCVRTDEQTTEEDAHEPLHAAKDASGDLEIYLDTGTESRQITSNEYDDDAPSQDPVTGDIVWQAQIDDRYQIMQYDFETGATTRITKEAYNSMQPSINDGDIVFQAWIGDDWEIVLIDDVDGREILTDNTEHDITPSITKDYIMWQAMEGGEWVGKVYDRDSKEIETVRGIAGGKVENPRMIMVFDSTKDNGDTETIGYDPVSGEVVTLAVTPEPIVPERIPEPEPQQEEKALVQPTTTTRTETKNATSTDTGAGNGEPNPDTASSTPVTPDIVIGGTPTTTPSAPTDTGLTLDLTAPAPVPDVTTVIPDLVIPTYNASSDASTSPSV